MTKNRKIIIFALVLLLVVFFAMSACKKTSKGGGETVVVTDANGVPITDENGEAITVVLETEIVEVTNADGEKVYDENGEVKTSIIYHSKEVAVPVTDKDGNVVRDKNGNIVTTKIMVPPTTGGPVVTQVAVTDANGNPVYGSDGEIITYTLVYTTQPATPGANKSNWGTTFGGSAKDEFTATAATPDGGFVAIVQTNSHDGSTGGLADGKITPYSVLIEYNKDGKVNWQKALAGNGVVVMTSIDVDGDGNIAVAGYSTADDIGFANYGDYDAVIYKFNANGDLYWVNSLGGGRTEGYNSVKFAPDGSIVTAGFIYSTDGNIKSSGYTRGDGGPVVVKYDANGNTVFVKGYGALGDYLGGVDVDPNGNIYAVGSFISALPERLFDTHGKADTGLLKLTPNGDLIWQKQLGGSKVENFPSVVATEDGCVVAGRSQSDDYEMKIIGNHGGYDAVALKYDSNGALVWTCPFRGYYDDFFNDIKRRPDGSFVAFGYSYSNNRDLKTVGNRGSSDGIVVTIDPYGNVSSAQGYGGSNEDKFLSGCILSNGEIIACGSTLSTDGDLVGSRVLSDGSKTVGMIAKFK